MLPMLGGQLDGNEKEACLSLDGGVAHRHRHHWRMGAPMNVGILVAIFSRSWKNFQSFSILNGCQQWAFLEIRSLAQRKNRHTGLILLLYEIADESTFTDCIYYVPPSSISLCYVDCCVLYCLSNLRIQPWGVTLTHFHSTTRCTILYRCVFVLVNLIEEDSFSVCKGEGVELFSFSLKLKIRYVACNTSEIQQQYISVHNVC